MANFFKKAIGIIITIFILLFVYAKFGPRLPISIVTQQKGEPLIVTEQGKAAAIPDIAKVTLGFEESGTNLETLQNLVNAKSKELVSELKKLGIDEKEIKTSSYNVYPQYNYDLRPARISGYRVSTRYEVTVENFDKVNQVLSKAAEKGVNLVGSISFELSDENKEKALKEAREEAVEKAKDKASGLAKAAGISLGKILNISENQGPKTEPIFLRESSAGIGGDIEEPSIQPGETEVIVNISISWEIK